MLVLEAIALIGACLIGLGLGGRGQKRNSIINIGAILLTSTAIWLIIIDWKLSIWLVVFDIAILYLLAFLINRKFGGLNHINSHLDTEKNLKDIKKLIENSKEEGE